MLAARVVAQPCSCGQEPREQVERINDKNISTSHESGAQSGHPGPGLHWGEAGEASQSGTCGHGGFRDRGANMNACSVFYYRLPCATL